VYNLTMSDLTGALHGFQAGKARVAVYHSASDAGQAAAAQAARLIDESVRSQGRARVIGATGNSQIPLANALGQQQAQWKAVELFHMDEYAGMKADHPASFRLWIKQRLVEKLHPDKVHYLEGDADDLEQEIERYSQLLAEAPVDLAFVGFGENGHIAFNDPPVANFKDAALVKVVTLDEACRRQQAGEGHFADVDAVPKQAATITCPGLFRANSWVCCVPEGRKAEAVRNALEGPVSEACPASLVQVHPNAYVYLDADSAALLSMAEIQLGSESSRRKRE
jgi:glucosamine-6-phosphate deaminase